MEQMTLPIEEQMLLLCAHEECELWQLMSGIGEVAILDTQTEQLELSRKLLLRYLDRGWVALARAHKEDGTWDPRSLATEEARVFISIDKNWAVDANPRGEEVVVVPTSEGEKALEAGAASAAFARIRKPRGS